MMSDRLRDRQIDKELGRQIDRQLDWRIDPRMDTEFRRHGIPTTRNSVDTEFRKFIFTSVYSVCYAMLFIFCPNLDGIPYAKIHGI
jgi:hypothetical protein